ncbi:MAG: helix-turn-helix domain-containing protein [Anaerolineae bacterium]|nr:helix-turn-helix domain-containing protein [Anaerolineae bacterium]
MKCPRCQSESVAERGKNHSGSQRYLCTRRQAVEMYLDGHSFRRIGRNLRVNPQSVANWVKRAGERALAAPIPQPPTDDDTVVERDELFTFVGRKNVSISSRRSSARGAASRAGRQPYPAMKRCYRRRWVKRHGHFSIAPTASVGMTL